MSAAIERILAALRTLDPHEDGDPRHFRTEDRFPQIRAPEWPVPEEAMTPEQLRATRGVRYLWRAMTYSPRAAPAAANVRSALEAWEMMGWEARHGVRTRALRQAERPVWMTRTFDPIPGLVWRDFLQGTHRFAALHAGSVMVHWPDRPGVGEVRREVRRETYRNDILGYLGRRRGVQVCSGCGQDGTSDDPQGNCDCCACSDCGRVTPAVSWCLDCGACLRCCSCERCDDCGERVQDCACTSSSCGLDSYHPRLAMHGEPTPLIPRYLGVEVEFGYSADREGTRAVRAACEKWACNLHDDGSISFDRSKELATSPARGQAFIEQIDEVCEALEKVEARVDKSCGLHVHVQADDLNATGLFSLIRLYCRVEAGMYSVCAPSRRRGHYSAAWAADIEAGMLMDTRLSTTERSKRLDVLMYDSLDEAERVKSCKAKHDSRYHGFNLNALHVHGTIEFRMHHGTVNPGKIIPWAVLCGRLVDYAASHTEAQIKALRGDSFEVLCKVAGDRKLVAWLKQRRAHFENRRLETVGLARWERDAFDEPEDSERVTAANE